MRAFVLGVEREMSRLVDLQLKSDGKPIPVAGTCHGQRLEWVVKTSAVMPRLRAMLGGKALACYAATYLGCSFGAWIGRAMTSEWGPGTMPFTLSRVTIVEQTTDRVVADVVEAPFEEVFDGVAKDSDGDGHTRPYTEAELAGYERTSRYTLTRGADAVWRVFDRKPPFEWECWPS